MKRKRMVGREILPGVIFHVSEDIQPETIEALQGLARCAIRMTDNDLKEVELYADFLKEKRNPKRKVGRPRKVKP